MSFFKNLFGGAPKENKPPVISTTVTIHIPYTRIASWLVGYSPTSGLFLVVTGSAKNSIQRRIGRYVFESTLHRNRVIPHLIHHRTNNGKEAGRRTSNFSQIYKELNAAVGEVAASHPPYDEDGWLMGFIAIAMTDWERHDSNFSFVLNYFEGNLADFKITPEEIDYYARIHGSTEAIRNLDSFCLCILIRAQRMIDLALKGKNISAEKHSLSINTVFEGILKNEKFGFAGLSTAVINLLESGAGDKPASQFKSEKQIREDIARFSKA